ncbi:CCL3 protein, partial [Hirundo rustica]|nr:CCL3 protein [Hirundo rustica]
QRGPRWCCSWGLTRAVCPSLAPTDGVPSTCCFSYQKQPIHWRRVSSVFDTSSSCSRPGVIVVTKKKKVLCANPQEKWVQELRKHLQSPEN